MKTDTTEYKNRPKPQEVDEGLLNRVEPPEESRVKKDQRKKVERLQR